MFVCLEHRLISYIAVKRLYRSLERKPYYRDHFSVLGEGGGRVKKEGRVLVWRNDRCGRREKSL